MRCWSLAVRSRLTFLPVLTLLSGCGADSPTRPDDGSNSTLTAPRTVEPAPNASITLGTTPLALIVENVASAGTQPVTYTFEVATDHTFANRVFVQEGVPAGGDGRTTATVGATLEPGVAYVWRARAQTAEIVGPNAPASAFSTEAARALGAPAAIFPAPGTTLREQSVEFVLAQSSRSGTLGAVSYRVEVALDEAMTSLVAVLTVNEQPGETRVPFNGTLQIGKRYYWRVKAFDGPVSSEWSPVHVFDAPRIEWPTTPQGVIAFVESRYASYLQPTGSLGQRQANMMFLRDRMIEAGLCGGMDLGWNLKRGGPEISIDFLTHRQNGHVSGIDIGHDYDDYRDRLQLTWAHGEFPFYAEFHPRPTCQ